MKVKTGEGRVPIGEFDRKNGKPLERKIGIGKEDTNGELFNADQPTCPRQPGGWPDPFRKPDAGRRSPPRP